MKKLEDFIAMIQLITNNVTIKYDIVFVQLDNTYGQVTLKLLNGPNLLYAKQWIGINDPIVLTEFAIENLIYDLALAGFVKYNEAPTYNYEV